MRADSASGAGPGLLELVERFAGELLRFVEERLRLAEQELRSEGERLRALVFAWVAAGAAFLVGFQLLAAALIVLLSRLMPLWVVLVIFALLHLAAGAALVAWARQRSVHSQGLMARTLGEIGKDRQWLADAAASVRAEREAAHPAEEVKP